MENIFSSSTNSALCWDSDFTLSLQIVLLTAVWSQQAVSWAFCSPPQKANIRAVSEIGWKHNKSSYFTSPTWAALTSCCRGSESQREMKLMQTQRWSKLHTMGKDLLPESGMMFDPGMIKQEYFLNIWPKKTTTSVTITSPAVEGKLVGKFTAKQGKGSIQVIGFWNAWNPRFFLKT